MVRTTLLATLAAALAVAAGPARAQVQVRAQDPMQQLPANFDRIDAQGDGAVSRADTRAAQAARWPQIDRNGDGYLAEDDFPRIAAQSARTGLAQLGIPDTDGDGRISRNEFPDGPAPVFGRAEGNGDGVLTRSEIAGAAR